jgi:mRNA interferase MazF
LYKKIHLGNTFIKVTKKLLVTYYKIVDNKRNGCFFEVFMIKRGELYYADLSPVIGSEQGGVRPVLVVQNDIGNKYSPTVIAAAVTSKLTKAKLPTHIELNSICYGLSKNSVVLLEQIRTIDKRRLKERIGELNKSTMDLVDNALLLSLGVKSPFDKIKSETYQEQLKEGV